MKYESFLSVIVSILVLILIGCGEETDRNTIETSTQIPTTQPSLTPQPTPTSKPRHTATSPSSIPSTRIDQSTPTAEPTPSATSTIGVVPTSNFVPTNEPSCANFLQFIEDITIPDGHEVTAGAEFTKTWRVDNLGSCYISNSYTLVPLNGGIEVVKIAPLPLIGPDEEGNLSITFRAPAVSGVYRSYWQIEPPDGRTPFGQLYLEIVVK